MKKVSINRNNILLAYCNNFVYLNPQLDIDDTIEMMQNVNNYMCLNPVSIAQIERIVKSVFKYKEDGTLQPIIFNKKRKVIFNKEFKAKPLEKLIIAGKEINKLKVESSKQKLYDTLETWDFDELGKITQSKVIKTSTLCRNTVQKYWSEFKEYVSILNNEYKTNKSTLEEQTEVINTNCIDLKLNPLEGVKMSDKVNVIDFTTALFEQLSEPLKANTIVDFSYVINKSYATIEEVIKMLFKVYKENQYRLSEYENITIPKELIQFIIYSKQRMMVA